MKSMMARAVTVFAKLGCSLTRYDAAIKTALILLLLTLIFQTSENCGTLLHPILQLGRW